MTQEIEYYQPERLEELPEGLAPCQVFRTKDGARKWLLNHGHVPREWHIYKYREDDIEGARYTGPNGEDLGPAMGTPTGGHMNEI